MLAERNPATLDGMDRLRERSSPGSAIGDVLIVAVAVLTAIAILASVG